MHAEMPKRRTVSLLYVGLRGLIRAKETRQYDRYNREEKKNWFVKHKILTVIIALVILGIIAASMNGGSKNASNNTAATSTASTSRTVVAALVPRPRLQSA